MYSSYCAVLSGVKVNMYPTRIKLIIYLISLLTILIFNGNTIHAFAQEIEKKDTAKVKIGSSKILNSQLTGDSVEIHKEVSPLDIGSDRGLFILSPDKLMQMRILGSVRALLNYSDQEMENKTSFNPYDIPTDVTGSAPNFYANLSQSRIGFEVTRRTKKIGDMFIRLETDFNGSSHTLRIRHAYGQTKRLLIGQTWSLFSNVSFVPATVSSNGVPGSATQRTPQIRYYASIKKILGFSAAIEYSTPDLEIPDSIEGNLLQVIPDFTGRFTYKTGSLSLQFSGVVTTMSGKNTEGNINYSFGIGGSLSGKLEISEKENFLFSFTTGRAISHFLNVFSGNFQDASFNPDTQKFKAAVSTSGYVSYSRKWPHNIDSSISAGIASIQNRDYQPDDAYNWSYSLLANAFWQPVEGARLGAEIAYGQRFDKGGDKGGSSRVSILLYYDF